MKEKKHKDTFSGDSDTHNPKKSDTPKWQYKGQKKENIEEGGKNTDVATLI